MSARAPAAAGAPEDLLSSAGQLAKLAMSGAPLTGATSLLRLLQPDVQEWIVAKQQAAATPQAPPSFGPASGAPVMRLATSVPGTDSDAPAFGRRRTQHAQRAQPSSASQSPSRALSSSG